MPNSCSSQCNLLRIRCARSLTIEWLTFGFMHSSGADAVCQIARQYEPRITITVMRRVGASRDLVARLTGPS